MPKQIVYHELSPLDKRDLKSLIETGLSPRIDSLVERELYDALSYERWFDLKSEQYLPEHLKNRGFSRLKSVFACPHNLKSKFRIVELVVDSEASLVAPMGCYTSATDYGQTDNGFVERYWSEALLLEEFLAKYKFKMDEVLNEFEWQDKDGFSYSQPEVMFRPESIIEFKKILPPFYFSGKSRPHSIFSI